MEPTLLQHQQKTPVHKPLGGPTGHFATSDVPARSSGVDLTQHQPLSNQKGDSSQPVPALETNKSGVSPSQAPLGLQENIALRKPSANCGFPTPKSHTQNSFIQPTSLSSTRSNRLSKSFCVSTANRHCAWSLRVEGSNKQIWKSQALRPSQFFLGFQDY